MEPHVLLDPKTGEAMQCPLDLSGETFHIYVDVLHIAFDMIHGLKYIYYHDPETATYTLSVAETGDHRYEKWEETEAPSLDECRRLIFENPANRVLPRPVSLAKWQEEIKQKGN